MSLRRQCWGNIKCIVEKNEMVSAKSFGSCVYADSLTVSFERKSLKSPFRYLHILHVYKGKPTPQRGHERGKNGWREKHGGARS